MSRPAKPLAIHAMSGTARKDRHAPEPTDAPVITAPAPLDLTEGEIKAWHHFVGLLAPTRVLSERDLSGLRLLAQTWAQWLELRSQIADLEGEYTYEQTSEKGGTTIRAHPLMALESDCARRLLLLLGRFGLTPSDRASLLNKGKSGSSAPTGDEEFAA